MKLLTVFAFLSHLLVKAKDNDHCPIREVKQKKFKVRHSGDSFVETSYMAHSQQSHNGNDVVWMGSDGRQDTISAVNLNTGKVVHTYELDILIRDTNDWEAISLGPCSPDPEQKTVCIYIGAIGNNDAELCRNQRCKKGKDVVQIHKFKEPSLKDMTTSKIPVATLILDYHHSDAPTNRANSESLFVDPTGDSKSGKASDIYIMTKFRGNEHLQQLFKVPARVHKNLEYGSTKKISMKPVGNSFLDKTWTGADMNKAGTLLAMRHGGEVFYFSRSPSTTIAKALQTCVCPFTSKSNTKNNKLHFEAVTMIGGDVAETYECPNQNKCKLIVTVHHLQY